MKFPYVNDHHCQALVIMCMDFRFWKATARYLKQELDVEEFDLVAFPGSAKMIVEQPDTCPAVESAAISTKLHQSEQIIIVNHADCGAYGGRKSFESPEKEKETHITDILKAVQILKSHFPFQKIFGLYVDLDPVGKDLIFEKIEQLNLLQTAWPTPKNYVPA